MNKTFKALADPTRRRILEMLRDTDLSAGDIAAEFSVAWASISHHLNVLAEAGLVDRERDGQHIRYSLNTTALQDLIRHLLTMTDGNGESVHHGQRRKG